MGSVQVHVDMVESFVFVGVMVVLTAIAGVLGYRADKKPYSGDEVGVAMVLGAIFIILGMAGLFIGMDRYAAPEFHAMEILLKAIPGAK